MFQIIQISKSNKKIYYNVKSMMNLLTYFVIIAIYCYVFNVFTEIRIIYKIIKIIILCLPNKH